MAKKPVIEETYMDRLKARGIDRKTLDLDISIEPGLFYDRQAETLHMSSGKALMEAILNSLVKNKDAEALINSILFPPK